MSPRFARFLCLGALAVTALVRAGAGPAGSPPPLSVKDFFGLPNVRSPKLSPDGKKIAFLFPHQNRMALGLFDRATGDSRLVLRGTDESLGSFFWKGNDRIVFAADFQGNESLFIGSTDLSGKNVLRIAETQPGEYLSGSAAGILSGLRADPEHIVVSGNFLPGTDATGASSTSSGFVIARLNVRNRGLSPLYTYHESERIWQTEVDSAGVLRLRARAENARELVWDLRETDEKPWREIARHKLHGYAETWRPLQFSADNVTLWLISREENDRGALYAYNTRARERGPAVFVPPEGEIDEIITSYDGARLLGVAYESDRRHYHWIDAARGSLQAKLESTFKGCEVRITSTSADEQVNLVWVGHDREPGVYFVLDLATGSLGQFKRTRDLDPARLSPQRAISYRARDGLEIHGYLTLPLGLEGRRVPLIIHPHGGPFGIRDSWGYNADAQFLASRGYAVLQPNYRGSGGYGREFLDRGRQQWGRAMQDDLSDAVKWAVEQGIADPMRVAIYGASYGGYAALAGVTLTPELYCCAANYVGAADLDITFKNRGDDAFRRSDDFDYQREWVGATAEYRAATSPVNLVERIRVPTLHAYGEKDPRVKIDHWTRLEAQLRKFGKPYEAIEEKKQGHGFRDEQASIGFYDRLEKFFASYLAPEGKVKIGDPKVIDLPAKN